MNDNSTAQAMHVEFTDFHHTKLRQVTITHCHVTGITQSTVITVEDGPGA